MAGAWVPVLGEVAWQQEGRDRQLPARLRWRDRVVEIEVETSWSGGPRTAGDAVLRRFMCRTGASPGLLYRITHGERTGSVRVERTRVPPAV